MQALANEREHLNNIILGTHAGTWEMNVQTGEAILNERWADIMGYALPELQPWNVQSWAAHCHPDDLGRVMRLMAEHLNGSLGYYECEFRMRHRDGSWVWVLDRGRVVAWGSSGRVAWSPRDAVSLSKIGFQGNPMGFRAVKLISEAAAALRRVQRGGAGQAALVNDPRQHRERRDAHGRAQKDHGLSRVGAGRKQLGLMIEEPRQSGPEKKRRDHACSGNGNGAVQSFRHDIHAELQTNHKHISRQTQLGDWKEHV